MSSAKCRLSREESARLWVHLGLSAGEEPPQPRLGEFIQTYTGRQVWPMDPRPEEICIEDIAHALSMQCRYAGHSLRFMSVAEHSVHIARWLREHYGPADALEGLLHDASEAYLIDVPRPVKAFLPGYKKAEAKMQGAIALRFGLSPAGFPESVHEADTRILSDERAQNMAPANYEGGWPPYDPLGVTLKFWSPAEAEEMFLFEFEQLTKRRAA